MADEVSQREVKLRVLGTREMNNYVSAGVFARKLATLVRAMEAADKAANGGRRFDYLIVKLEAASASAVLRETRVSRALTAQSSVEAFGRCAEAISVGRLKEARSYPECVIQIHALAKDVEDTFDRAELTVNGFKPIIIDRAFLEQAATAARDDPSDHDYQWFKGWAIGSFDGRLLEADFRGDVATAILRLTAGNIDIPCTCPGMDYEEDLKPIFTRRVRIIGNALYNGSNGLPVRIEISGTPQLVREGADFQRWRGAFEPFEPKEWSDDL